MYLLIMKFLVVLCAFIQLCVIEVQCARILGIMHMPSFSHQIVFRPLWKQLSLRGHQVTILTTDPMKDSSLTNLTEIDWHKSYSFWGDYNLINTLDKSVWTAWGNFSEMQAEFIDEQLSHPQVEKLIRDPTEHFDLLIIEGFHTAHYAFAHRFKCPFISILSLDAPPFVHEEIGNPSYSSLYPDFMLPFQGRLTFRQRLESNFFDFYSRFLQYYYMLPAQQQIVRKHFGSEYPKIESIFKNYSAFLLNTNNILQPVRPLLPNVVQIGGGNHLTKPKPLPQDLQNILDSSGEGVIYFSLGSNVKGKHISGHTLDSITNAFKELPYKVLWKFENEHLPNKPNNVIISKWFPQQDILRHPNIKLFITQGGLQSIEEALGAEIPMIGIPVIGDQQSNVKRLASKGMGVLLEYKSITKESFKSTILEVITNPRYRDAIKMYSGLARDQPQTGIERAVWWTEYVLRHKGAQHLRNPALDIAWYQFYLLDIIAFCVTILIIVSYLIFKVIYFFLNMRRLKIKDKQM